MSMLFDWLTFSHHFMTTRPQIMILTVSELEKLKIQILNDIASGVALTIITNISNNQSIDIKQRIGHLSQ